MRGLAITDTVEESQWYYPGYARYALFKILAVIFMMMQGFEDKDRVVVLDGGYIKLCVEHGEYALAAMMSWQKMCRRVGALHILVEDQEVGKVNDGSRVEEVWLKTEYAKVFKRQTDLNWVRVIL